MMWVCEMLVLQVLIMLVRQKVVFEGRKLVDSMVLVWCEDSLWILVLLVFFISGVLDRKISFLVCSVMVVDMVMFFMVRLKVLLVGEKFSGESSMMLFVFMMGWMMLVVILCIMLVSCRFMLLIMFIGWVVMKLLEIMWMVECVMGVLGKFWLKVVLMFRCSLLVVFLVYLRVVLLVMCRLFWKCVLILCRVSCLVICGCELCIIIMWMFSVCSSERFWVSICKLLVVISLFGKVIMKVLLWKVWIQGVMECSQLMNLVCFFMMCIIISVVVVCRFVGCIGVDFLCGCCKVELIGL